MDDSDKINEKLLNKVPDAAGEPAEIVAVNRDVTNKKNAELDLYQERDINVTLAEISEDIISPEMTVEEIAFKVHRAALKLTESSYGYASSVDPDDGANVIHTFSAMMDDCNVRNKRIVFRKGPKAYPGLWGHSLNTGEGFFTNNPGEHAASLGVPEGHIPLNNFLSVPALFKKTVLGQISLADKPGGYTERDLETIQKLANIYAVAIFRTRTENELYASIARAQESDRLKSTFLASMSHEIRTPLNAIIGFLDIVLSDEDVSDEHTEYLEHARQSGDVLLRILSDILDFSKIEAEELELESVDFSLKDLLVRVERLGSMLLKGKNVVLDHILTEEADIVLYGDPYRLEQILINLVSNAIKFTDEGRVDFGVSLEGGELLRFYVKDTGSGIPEEKRDIIFQAFRQAEEKTTRKHGGTGLGLAITKRLIEKMGGTISFESELGKGTVFYFVLPFVRGETIEKEKAPAAEDMRSKGEQSKTVLVVDDNEINRRVIQTMLSKAGHHSIAAKNGSDAVTALQKNPGVALVLMDMYMPVLDGIEATKRIRELEQAGGMERIPVIALTAAGTLEDRELMLNAGCDGYLSKPLNRELLLEELRKWL